MRRLALASRPHAGGELLAAHAGRCLRFLVYELDAEPATPARVLQLAASQSLYLLADGEEHPLDSVDLVLAASVGAGVRAKLARRGIQARVAARAEVGEIVRQWRSGVLLTHEAEATPAGRRGCACRSEGDDSGARQG